MENFEIIKLIAVVFIGLFLLKILWSMTKGVIKLLLGVLIIGIGLYIMKPEMLHGVFGKDRVENAVDGVKDEFDSLKQNAKNRVKKSFSEVTI